MDAHFVRAHAGGVMFYLMKIKIYILGLFLFTQLAIASEENLIKSNSNENRNIERVSIGDPSKEIVLSSGVQVEGLGVIKPTDIVQHPKFGLGKVDSILEYETGVQIIRIEFEEYGFKSLMLSHANLSRAE